MVQTTDDCLVVASENYSSNTLAVERVILVMRERLQEPLSLQDMAEIANLSPYHFCRIFHRLTGIPPGIFLTGLRLATAKRLLLTTTLSVTDICFEVGYSSLGSFITLFTRLVGLPPRHLRQAAEHFAMPSPESLGNRGTPLLVSLRLGIACWVKSASLALFMALSLSVSFRSQFLRDVRCAVPC